MNATVQKPDRTENQTDLLRKISTQAQPKFSTYSNKIIQEVTQVLMKVCEEEAAEFIDLIVKAKIIVVCGAGRMGMMGRAFTMRLKHLNFNAYHIQDCNTPKIGKDDLLIVCSGSGETKTILALVEIAKMADALVALITTKSNSSMSRLSHLSVILQAPSKLSAESNAVSIQPMTTLVEQSSLLFFDTIILMLMNKLGQTGELLKTRHSILE